MNDGFVYLFILILIIILIGFWIWAYIMIRNYNDCLQNQSAYCPNIYCDVPSEACDNLPYRTDTNTGETICAYYLLELSAPIIEIETGNGEGGG